MIPNDYQMLWVELHNRAVPTCSSCVDYGWAACSKWDTSYQARHKIVDRLSHESGVKLVMVYPEDHCARKYSNRDKIFGIFC